MAKKTAAKSAPTPSGGLPAPEQRWVDRLASMLTAIGNINSEHGRYADANRDSVARAIEGRDPFSTTVSGSVGARMVVNISSAHVPGFCAASLGSAKAYKNCYDLAPVKGWQVSKLRAAVDAALPVSDPKATYFAAAELNGCGIRFYGDMCFVLRPMSTAAKTKVLDRNSFEVLRDPVASQLRVRRAPIEKAREDELLSWSGTWGADLGAIVGIRALNALSSCDRRWTIGQVSSSICEDEDYIEVLMPQSFSAKDLQEVRVPADEAAQDAWIGGRLGRGPTPNLESLIWRQRRRNAERALSAAGVPVRIVTTSGRTRG